MPCNTCEGYRTLPPRLEAKIKLVVLDPLNAADTFLSHVSLVLDPRLEVRLFYAQHQNIL